MAWLINMINSYMKRIDHENYNFWLYFSNLKISERRKTISILLLPTAGIKPGTTYAESKRAIHYANPTQIKSQTVGKIS